MSVQLCGIQRHKNAQSRQRVFLSLDRFHFLKLSSEKFAFCVNFAQSLVTGNKTVGIGSLSIDLASSSNYYTTLLIIILTLMEFDQPGLRMFCTRAGTRVNYYRRFATLDDRIIGSAKRDTGNSNYANDGSRWLRLDIEESRLVGR